MSSNATLNVIPTMLSIHLSDIENEKVQVIEDYFCGETDEKREFELYINDYLSEIRQRIDILESNPKEQIYPFVIIGSTIEIEDMEDGEIIKLKIVSPFFKSIDSTTDCASYLSPVGKGLLLKNVNEIASIETPTGQFEYKIKLIENPILAATKV